MPIFEYVCLDCNNVFETLVIRTDEEIKCPACGSTRLEKAMSAFASLSSGGGGLSSCGSSGGFS